MGSPLFTRRNGSHPVDSTAEQEIVTLQPIPTVEHKEVEAGPSEESLFQEMPYKTAWKVLSEAVDILVTYDDKDDYYDPTIYDQYSKAVLASVDLLRKGIDHYPCFRGASHEKTTIEGKIEKLRLQLLPEKQKNGSLGYRASVMKTWHDMAVELRAELAQCAPKKRSCCGTIL